MALTFNGMGDKATMTALIDELETYGIKATFFLPGIRVAEEPDIAGAIWPEAMKSRTIRSISWI